MTAKEQAPKHRTICTQTDYRDESAQTDPYSPDYVIKPGVQPELLTLATLSYGQYDKTCLFVNVYHFSPFGIGSVGFGSMDGCQ